jgi:hypothetical protein
VTSARRARRRRDARADDGDLGDVGVDLDAAGGLALLPAGISVCTASMSSLSMMNVMRLRSCDGAAWMIRRTLISASARSRKTWAAMPG